MLEQTGLSTLCRSRSDATERGVQSGFTLSHILTFLDTSSCEVESLRKQAYSIILKILPPKNEKFQIKILIFFLVCAQNIDCGYSLEPPRRGGSNEYHNLCFRAEIKKIMFYPVNPSFTI